MSSCTAQAIRFHTDQAIDQQQFTEWRPRDGGNAEMRKQQRPVLSAQRTAVDRRCVQARRKRGCAASLHGLAQLKLRAPAACRALRALALQVRYDRMLAGGAGSCQAHAGACCCLHLCTLAQRGLAGVLHGRGRLTAVRQPGTRPAGAGRQHAPASTATAAPACRAPAIARSQPCMAPASPGPVAHPILTHSVPALLCFALPSALS